MKILFLTFSFWFIAFSLTQAATIEFAISDNQVAIGEEVKVELVIRTNSENINALQGEISWPGDQLELIKVQDNFSIVSLWIKDPKKSATTTPGQLSFAGLIPSGFGEPQGQILSLIFRPREVGPAEVVVKEALVLLNDGRGTNAKTVVQPLQLKIYSAGDFSKILTYLLFLIAGIIIIIFIWRIIRRRKSGAV